MTETSNRVPGASEPTPDTVQFTITTEGQTPRRPQLPRGQAETGQARPPERPRN